MRNTVPHAEPNETTHHMELEEVTMSKLINVWTGTGFNKDVKLMQYEYEDGTRNHYTFYPRVGAPANPTESEVPVIIKNFRLQEVRA